MSNVKIIPVHDNGPGFVIPDYETRVLVGGVEMDGVYEIDVREERNGLRKAIIHCYINQDTDHEDGMSLTRYVRVVHADKGEGEQAQASAGTRVFCGDQEITGITKLTLTAEVGQPWMAVIECLVIPPEVEAECA